MTFLPVHIRRIARPVFLWLALAGGAIAEELPKEVMPFLNQHCFECHDEDVSKGDLDLASLTFKPTDSDNFAVWQRVFDRVKTGEMPPKKKERPKEEDKKEFLAGIGPHLHEADMADIKENGRVRSRRLTRVEYEHTVHDLLGVDIPLKTLLPEDPAAHGFETVADAQQLSHHHLARYLDVADRALNEAFSRALEGDKTYKKESTPKDLTMGEGRGNYRGPDLRNGESIAWPLRVQFYGRVPATRVPEDGWYQVTLKQARGINTGKDGAVWGTLRSGTCYSNAPVLYMLGTVEATKEPRDLVYRAWIREGHMLELKPNDGNQKHASNGHRAGGTVSFKGRDLAKQGYAGIAHKGIVVERIYPNASRDIVVRNLFGKEDLSEAKNDPATAVDRLVTRFARRAFRRPINPQQAAPYAGLAKAALEEGASLTDALRVGYRAILCSPRFLIFTEPAGKLDDYALASRLSYTFWVSMPDWKLIQAAQEGKLRQPEVMKTEVARLLADPKSERFIKSFTDQWLNLKEIDFTSPDRRQFPTFDPVVQESMLEETRMFIADLIQNNKSVSNLIDSDHAYLNGRLARHYRLDVKTKPGAGLQKISLSKDNKNPRGGLLTQGAVLKVTADGNLTSPVVRGVFVNERILGVHLAPPPPDVPAVEPDIRGATTVRELLDKHRSSESCASCHVTIDPPGFMLENFDPVGGWRTKYGIGGKGKPVDASSYTPQGQAFNDIREWKQIYLKRQSQLSRAFAEQFLTYATGAPIRFADRKSVAEIVATAEKADYGLQTIIQEAVSSPVFTNK